jgi:hypothetical protein
MKIIQNLERQHNAVRQNMMGLFHARSKELVRAAEREIASLEVEAGQSDGRDREEEEKETEEIQRSLHEMVQRLRVTAREGAKAEDYQLKPGHPEFNLTIPGPSSSRKSDVEMSGMGPTPIRSSAAIRKELSVQLRDLVEQGTAELKAYDKHAAETLNIYKASLERRQGRRGSAASGAVQSPVTNSGPAGGNFFGGGILRNSHEQSPVDVSAMRRMSGVFQVPRAAYPSKTIEAVEEIARRG